VTTLRLVPLILLLGCFDSVAERYLTTEEALALVFENSKSVRRLALANRAPAAAKKLLAFSGELKEGGRGVAFIDAVIGKHEPITYMLVLDEQGAVQRLEILEYRESYGGQVRYESWREQFHGKKHGDPLRHGTDVRNIAGATLSCRHVTEGVQKLLQIFAERKTSLLTP
jgi:Na+-translocating ferredoxin:NAD+ oxidoreductase RnfG subunit